MNTPFRPSFRGPRPQRNQPPPDQHRINHRITARDVVVIGPDGEQLGELSVRDALIRAEEYGLDLVEVAPNATPPVCKILDYGKFKYREQKKDAESRKNRSDTVLKEIRIRYRTDVGDLEVKLRQAREFIEEGDKVKVTLRFRGREMAHQDLGIKVLDRIRVELAELTKVESMPRLENRQMIMVLAPK